MMANTYKIPALGIVLIAVVFSPLRMLQAKDLGQFELGFRPSINAASGEPTNDISAVSLIGRYRLNSDWWIGAELEIASEFDVENPHKFIGLTSSKTVDAIGSYNQFGVFAERRYGQQRQRGDYWYWTAGIGISKVSVDNAIGQTTQGGPYNIVTDASTETILRFGGGRQHRLNNQWSLGYGARVEQHFAKWKIRDQISGQTGTIDDYRTVGVFVDINYRF